ncbi:MAG: hypothetical protein CMJ59_16025 [Planctomycetaceae bacterium]|nr:hypothetical protein [Planctomycetaceae bacterium]
MQVNSVVGRGRRFKALVSVAFMVGFAGASVGVASELSEQLARRAGLKRAVTALLGTDTEVAVDLAHTTEWLIHVRMPSGAKGLRDLAQQAGLGIDRLVAENGPLDRLPYADNTLDVLIATEAGGEALSDLSLSEILRVLRPEGTAIIGKALQSNGADADPAALKKWASGGRTTEVAEWSDDTGTWVQFGKPLPAGIDEWTHWEKGPDNNPVSTDSVIRAPYMTQFMADPLYIGMPSVTTAAGGRTFLAIGHIAHHAREWDTLYKLIARNGYNGTVLWSRDLPDGYQVHRSAFIATRDTFYMINGDHALLLDPATGRELGRVRLPGVPGFWKWMVLRDNVLFVLTGKREPGTRAMKGDRTFGGWSWGDLSAGYYGKDVPYGFGHTLAAYDLKEKQLLWKHREETLIDSRAMSLQGEKMFLFCPDKHVRCLSTTQGEVIWTNDDPQVRNLIQQPGKGLTSTPGFRTMCITMASPDALVIQGQTRMNVTALSTKDGYVLWTKRKVTNNPNAIFVDGKIILGVGQGGTHVAIDPLSGKELEDLKFRKTACTRLTASGDSFFCRGEGTLRYDRESKRVLIDGAQRPACNDGAIPAHGLLYLGPWQCDCNLSLIGNIAKCSAGDFDFDRRATAAENLTVGRDDLTQVKAFPITNRDWPTLRADNDRSSSTQVKTPTSVQRRWHFLPDRDFRPVPAVAAGGLVFSTGTDGAVRAIVADTGEVSWVFPTAGPIKQPPTLWGDRLYVGSGDGHAYCLEAASGELLWSFRAAPIERHIMVYGNLTSTWPVNSGILVDQGTAYLAAGIVDHDGTYVYALDAITGEIRWQNNASGHLSPALRKGVSVQGNLSLLGDQLLLAGGNQVSPAIYDRRTGECRAKPFDQGQPKANAGQFVGVFQKVSVMVGGRILYSAAENVATKGWFNVFGRSAAYRFNSGGIPPAWNDDTLAVVDFKHGKVAACDSKIVAAQIDQGYGDTTERRGWLRSISTSLREQGAMRWQSDLDEGNKFETISLAVSPNAVVAVLRFQQRFRSQTQWFVVAMNAKTGAEQFRHELQVDPLPGGLLVDRDGQVIVTMIDGGLLCLGGNDP